VVSSIHAASISAILCIVKAGRMDLSDSVVSEDQRLFPAFAVNAMTSFFYREALLNFVDFSQASASPALYHWLTASG